MDANLTRRRLFKLAGGLAAALGLGAVTRSWPGDEPALAVDDVACVLTPEHTEGPYYIAGEKVRRNITEGRPGTPLTLRLTVVDSRTCKPIKGAAVDIWHCDASGAYSGFGAGRASRTFMRGIQRTNANGVAIFKTVYPGWYPGRTVHIHVKVHVRGNVVHTGQLYFSDRVTDAVYRRPPTPDARTARHGMPTTRCTRTAAGARSSDCSEAAPVTSARSRWASAAPEARPLDRRASGLRQDLGRHSPRSEARPSLVQLRCPDVGSPRPGAWGRTSGGSTLGIADA
jgi:protocatechuate 3,4-dioxygenase beta subunit